MKRGGILSRDSLIASTSFVQYLFDAPQDGFYDDTVVKMHPKQVAIRVRQQLIHRNRSQTAVIAFSFIAKEEKHEITLTFPRKVLPLQLKQRVFFGYIKR